MTSPASLRDLYTPPSTHWSFVPPTPANATSSSPSPAPPPSYQWSTRQTANPLYDLSASLTGDESGLDVKEALQSLIASVLLRYATTALSIPWEVGKTLLQVQWVPRSAGESMPGTGLATDEEDEELSDSSNDDSYFADPSNPQPDADGTMPRLPADERGYVVRQSLLDEGTIPEYVIPVGSADGTWGMMKRLGRFRPEGWLALWKGLLTSAVMESLYAGIEPNIHNLLESLLSPSPFGPPPLILPVASQVLTGFLLSPLDLVRTRLIVQSSHPRYRTYSGPIDALRQILTHEGGLRGVYLHPHLLVPTLIDYTLRSLVPLTLPGLVASYLSFGGVPITPETHPTMWGVSEFLGTCAGLLIILPFETVRRRLQVQVRGTAKPIKACVELRPVPYNGIVDAFWHILTEERSDLPLKSKRRRRKSVGTKGKASERGEGVTREGQEDESREGESWLRNTGIGQLYRGLGMRVSASLIVFVLSMVSGGDEHEAGWAEL